MAASTTTPEPAEIQVFDPASPASKIDTIPCKFRPNQIKLEKSASWTDKSSEKNDVPFPTFSGGQAASLSLSLFFDTTDTSTDVRKVTDKLLKLPLKNAAKKQPPLCRFVWGKLTSFLAYVPSVSVTFTMFLGNGTPVRAEAQLTLKQYKDEALFKAQNPTSRSEARKTWIVEAGQTIDWIAYQEYGDASKWRHIAETNRLANPLDLRPGQVLRLTPIATDSVE
jgi:nucleoid-associated protein YgaU